MDQEYKFKVGKLRKLFAEYKQAKGKEKTKYDRMVMREMRTKVGEAFVNHIVSFINTKIDGIEEYWGKVMEQEKKRGKYNENLKEIIKELKVGDIILDGDETEWKVLEVLHDGNCVIQKRRGKMSYEIKFEDDHWEEELDEEDQEKDKEPNMFELMFIKV